jgi:hypothetical protein
MGAGSQVETGSPRSFPCFWKGRRHSWKPAWFGDRHSQAHASCPSLPQIRLASGPLMEQKCMQAGQSRLIFTTHIPFFFRSSHLSASSWCFFYICPAMPET